MNLFSGSYSVLLPQGLRRIGSMIHDLMSEVMRLWLFPRQEGATQRFKTMDTGANYFGSSTACSLVLASALHVRKVHCMALYSALEIASGDGGIRIYCTCRHVLYCSCN